MYLKSYYALPKALRVKVCGAGLSGIKNKKLPHRDKNPALTLIGFSSRCDSSFLHGSFPYAAMTCIAGGYSINSANVGSLFNSQLSADTIPLAAGLARMDAILLAPRRLDAFGKGDCYNPSNASSILGEGTY